MSVESNHQQGNPEAPPPAEMESSSSRQKRSRKGALIATGALVTFLGGAWIMLFGGGQGNQPTTLDGEQIATARAIQSGGAAIQGSVREGGIGGGVRQEVASLQAEIEDEEYRQERLGSERSVIRFGESLIEDDAEEINGADSSAEENSTFGEIRPEPARADVPREFPVNPGRQQVRIAGGGGANQVPHSSGAGSMAAAIAQEMQLYSAQQQASSSASVNEVYYAPPVVMSEVSNQQDASGAEPGESRYAQGELAMPGDIVAAYMENRITSDQPSGRVVATILEGPMEGGRAIGEASFEGDRLLIRFNRIVTQEGDLIGGIEALAVDPNTWETSLQSGVNRKLFRRYGVPLLYGIAAIGLDYASERGSTTVVEQDLQSGQTVRRSVRTDPSFGEYMTENVSDSLKQPLGRAASEAANVRPTAWANPGVIGLLFDSAVPSGR